MCLGGCEDAYRSQVLLLVAAPNKQRPRHEAIVWPCPFLPPTLPPCPCAAGLQGKVDALASAARMRAGAPSAGAGAPELSTAVDPASLEGVYTALSQFSEALTKLQVGWQGCWGVGGRFGGLAGGQAHERACGRAAERAPPVQFWNASANLYTTPSGCRTWCGGTAGM